MVKETYGERWVSVCAGTSCRRGEAAHEHVVRPDEGCLASWEVEPKQSWRESQLWERAVGDEEGWQAEVLDRLDEGPLGVGRRARLVEARAAAKLGGEEELHAG